jgi:hypothetical protein
MTSITGAMRAGFMTERKLRKLLCFSECRSGAGNRSKVLIEFAAPYIVTGGTWQDAQVHI